MQILYTKLQKKIIINIIRNIKKYQWGGVHEYDESYSYYNRKTTRKWW